MEIVFLYADRPRHCFINFHFATGLFVNKQPTFIHNGQMATLQLWSLQSYNNNHFTPKLSDEVSLSKHQLSVLNGPLEINAWVHMNMCTCISHDDTDPTHKVKIE